jgi:hypothetical protein
MFGGGGEKVKVSKTLFDKLGVAAGILGCTVEEFVERTLTNETQKVIAKTGNKEVSAKEVEEISNQLKGLGYLE